MTQTDSGKESTPDDPPSTPPQVSVPPPYDTVAPKESSNHEREATWDDATFDTRPGNHLKISRSKGALTGFRFTIDPNIQLPRSLQPRTSRWNVELAVDDDDIEAEVNVLPYGHTPEKPLTQAEAPKPEGKKVHIKAATKTGNITLRVNVAPDTPLVITADSSQGNIRIHLPRTFLGPLALSSRAPARLSAALRRAATPLRQEDGTTHWFVGDVAAWSARDEVGDTASARCYYGAGRVWVGFVGDEPLVEPVTVKAPEERHALVGGIMAVGSLAVLLAFFWAPVVCIRSQM